VPWLAAAGAAVWVGLAEAVGKVVAEVARGAVAVGAVAVGSDVGAVVALGPHAASHGLTTDAVIQDVLDRVPIP